MGHLIWCSGANQSIRGCQTGIGQALARQEPISFDRYQLGLCHAKRHNGNKPLAFSKDRSKASSASLLLRGFQRRSVVKENNRNKHGLRISAFSSRLTASSVADRSHASRSVFSGRGHQLEARSECQIWEKNMEPNVQADYFCECKPELTGSGFLPASSLGGSRSPPPGSLNLAGDKTLAASELPVSSSSSLHIVPAWPCKSTSSHSHLSALQQKTPIAREHEDAGSLPPNDGEFATPALQYSLLQWVSSKAKPALVGVLAAMVLLSASTVPHAHAEPILEPVAAEQKSSVLPALERGAARGHHLSASNAAFRHEHHQRHLHGRALHIGELEDGFEHASFRSDLRRTSVTIDPRDVDGNHAADEITGVSQNVREGSTADGGGEPGVAVQNEERVRGSEPAQRLSHSAQALGGGASATDYSQLTKDRGDTVNKMGMFTQDAWTGMLRLKDYDRLVEKYEEEEKQCKECTKNRRLLEQVWQTVSNDYFDQYGRFSQSEWSSQLARSLERAGGPYRTKAQAYAAAKEMVATLGDRWSAFLEPALYRLAVHRPIPSEVKYLALQYTGIGIELGPVSRNGGLTIVAPFAGSPAEEEGIVGGERLLAVNGLSVAALTSDEAVALLRGPSGSMVEVEVAGSSVDSPSRILTLERRALPLPPLTMQLINGPEGLQVEYIRLHYFTHEGTNDMMAAITQGEALGVDGYILDLRNNPGGVFEEAIAMAGLWLDCRECDVAETVRSTTSMDADVEDAVYIQGHLPESIFGNHPGALTRAPLAIITNRSTASASEVLTGALRDNQRATVIGERTFGKGVVQYYFPMDDGSGLKLTVAKFLTPSRYDISRQGGLPPDVPCSDHPRRGASDWCIRSALETVAQAQAAHRREPLSLDDEAGPYGRMPYRWLPTTRSKRLWAGGTTD